MKHFLFIIIFTLAGGCVLSQESGGTDKVLAGNMMNWHLISAAGTSFENGNYSMDGSLGQPVTGLSSGKNYSLADGFWYTGMELQLSAELHDSEKQTLIVLHNIIDNGILQLILIDNDIFAVEIIDISGSVLSGRNDLQENFGEAILSFDVNAYPSGVYFIKAVSANSVSIHKFLIVK